MLLHSNEVIVPSLNFGSQAPTIILFQIENNNFIKKKDKLIVSFGWYNEI